MSENTLIEWTEHTFNPIRGCTKVSPGCVNCYAARDAVRFPGIRGIWGDKGTRIVAVPDAWKAPKKWNRLAGSEGSRRRVFCASLADVFEDWKGELRFPADIAPKGWVTARWDGAQLVREFEDSANAQGLRPATMDDLRAELFQLIDETPNLDWQLLTKRPENVMRMVPEHWQAGFPPNVWMGTTVEDQIRADERIPLLLQIPAKVRFLSCEPLLGPVDLTEIGPFGETVLSPQCWGDCGCDNLYGYDAGCTRNGGDGTLTRKIDWVICGGESGPNARPMHSDWARALRDECNAAGVPFLFKQWGEWHPALDLDEMYFIGDDNEFADSPMQRIGKKAAGRRLDGREYNEFPEVKQ